jgi:hypothetical protein
VPLDVNGNSLSLWTDHDDLVLELSEEQEENGRDGMFTDMQRPRFQLLIPPPPLAPCVRNRHGTCSSTAIPKRHPPLNLIYDPSKENGIKY